jgi:Flp pilus assembly protein TadG
MHCSTTTKPKRKSSSGPPPQDLLCRLTERIRRLHPARRSDNGPESGQALVEFAMVLPFLLILLLLILDFGRAINYWVDTTHLASEGARLAAVDNDKSGGLQAYIKNEADTEELKTGGPSGVVAPGLQVCVEYPEGQEVGNPVKVTVSADYNWLPFLSNEFGITTTTISGSATHRIEQGPTPKDGIVTEGCVQ